MLREIEQEMIENFIDDTLFFIDGRECKFIKLQHSYLVPGEVTSDSSGRNHKARVYLTTKDL